MHQLWRRSQKVFGFPLDNRTTKKWLPIKRLVTKRKSRSHTNITETAFNFGYESAGDKSPVANDT